MNIIEAYKEARKSSYRIINADKTRIIDFSCKYEVRIYAYDEKGNFIDKYSIKNLEVLISLYVIPVLNMITDTWDVVE